VELTASIKNVRMPSRVLIPEGRRSASFRVETNPSGENEDALITASSVDDSAATSLSIRAIRPSTVNCESHQIVPGHSTICTLYLSAAAVSDSQTFKILTSSPDLKAPSELTTRTGRDRIRFEAFADPESAPGLVTIEARLGRSFARETLDLLMSGVMHLSAPTHVEGLPGSAIHFQVSARDGQNLPLRVSISGQPGTATFNTQSGDFEWVPLKGDVGRHLVTFLATNATGVTIEQTTTLEVDMGRPRISSLRNGAGSSAMASCTSGSIATVVGSFPDNSRLLLNGSEATVLSTATDHIDFLCPMLDSGASLEVTVETAGLLSNSFRTTISNAAPGIFTTAGTGSGQAIAWRKGSTAKLAAIPTYQNSGQPVLGGDQLTILVTGINCKEDLKAEILQLNVANALVVPDSIDRSSRPGACEVGITVPDGVSGDAVPLTLSVTDSSGRVFSSNVTSIAVEENLPYGPDGRQTGRLRRRRQGCHQATRCWQSYSPPLRADLMALSRRGVVAEPCR
jgi:uncharacterized protein (TIGR03437 family)